MLNVCAKNEGDRTNGLGGFREQTNGGPHAINDKDLFSSKDNLDTMIIICENFV